MPEFDTIDAAYQCFESLLPELEQWYPTIATEQDTRLKVIDPIFTRVLGWFPDTIQTEDPTGDGYVDYKFTVDGMARLIVEAKKDAVSLGLSGRTPGRAYRLRGPVLGTTPQPHEGILQAIRYCGAKNAEIACLTNGAEWIIFRGSRLGDGRDTLDGMGIVFPNLLSVKENFRLFFDLLAAESARKYTFRAFFQEAEGLPIRSKSFSRTIRHVDSYRLLDRVSLSHDLDRLMRTFFEQISQVDDSEMLAKCFVTTKESHIADERLCRIADELVNRVVDLDTDEGKALTQIIHRVQETQRNEFVVIVGTKGAGKSTFIERFFRHVLPKNTAERCVVARLNVGESDGNEASVASWLDERLLSLLEQVLFGESGPSFEELQGMFFDEYRRWMSGPHKFLYESNKTEFKIRFGQHIDERREQRPQEYIRRLIRHIVCSRKKIPCLVFDNTDHFSIEFQERVFQYARSLYEGELCLVIVPITDKTSWQLSQQGALQSFDSESFFLPTPLPKTVLGKRIAYFEECLSQAKLVKGTGYFFGKGIHLSIENLGAFVSCLNHVFLETGMVAQWIGSLANCDIRRCLRLAREIVSSPYIRIEELLNAYVSKTTINVSEVDIKRAIIRKGYNIYPSGQHEFVQNIYSLATEVESSPLLGLRVLRLLSDAKHHEASGLEDYVSTDQVLEYLQAIGIERRATLLCLDALLKTGLCFSYDPTVTDVQYVKKVQLSPSGIQHLYWASRDDTYIGIMLQVTPIVDEGAFQRINAVDEHSGSLAWRLRVLIFIQYLLDEDFAFTREIDHPAYEGQRKLRRALEGKARWLRRATQQM